jgi:hypothetical protein
LAHAKLSLGKTFECQPKRTCWLLTLRICTWEIQGLTRSYRSSTKEETHWLQMGVQGQVQGRWHTRQVQGTVGCKRVLIAREHRLRGDLWSYNKDEHHLISSIHGSTIWLEGPLNECEEHLPQWRFEGRSLHVSNIGFSSSREGASYVQTEKICIWLEVGTEGMVH